MKTKAAILRKIDRFQTRKAYDAADEIASVMMQKENAEADMKSALKRGDFARYRRRKSAAEACGCEIQRLQQITGSAKLAKNKARGLNLKTKDSGCIVRVR